MKFMMWQFDKDSGKNPFEYYENKYGKPSVFATGKGVQIIPPNGVVELEIRVPDGHLWIGDVAELAYDEVI